MGVTHKDRGEHVVGDLTVLDDLVIHDDVTITGDIVLAGDFTIGEAGTGSDLLIYGDGTGASVLFDTDENLCQFTEYDLQIGTQAAPRTRTSGTNDHYTVGVFSHIEADEDTTLTLRSLWARFAVDANVQIGSSGGWGEGVNAIEGNVKLYGGVTGTGTQVYCWQIAGVWAMLECDNTDHIYFETGSHAAGLFAHIELGEHTNVKSGGVAAAVVAFSNSHASATIGGDYVGVYVDMESGKKAFTHGIKVEDSVSTTGLDIGSCATAAITLTGTSTAGIDMSAGSITTDIKLSNSATLVNTSNTLTVEEATTAMQAATLFGVESADIRLGLSSSIYMDIAVAVTTGNVVITHTGGNNRSVTWTASGGFDFVGDIALDTTNLDDHDLDNVAHLGLGNQAADDKYGANCVETLDVMTDNNNRCGYFAELTAYKSTGDYTGVVSGGHVKAIVSASNAQAWSNATAGLRGICGDLETITGTGAAKTIAGAASVYADATISGTAANDILVTNLYGLYVAAQTSVGNNKLTNDYGIYIASQAGGQTKNVGINIDGTSVGLAFTGTVASPIDLSAASATTDVTLSNGGTIHNTSAALITIDEAAITVTGDITAQGGGITAGKDTSAGTYTLYPGTTGTGITTITMSDNTGDTTTNLNVAGQTGARTYTIPDTLASTASFVMTEGIQDIDGAKNFLATLGVGKDETAGTLELYPSTSTKGTTTVTMADNDGDTITNLAIAGQTGSRTYTVPDTLAATASFVMTEGIQEIDGAKNFVATLGVGKDETAGTLELYPTTSAKGTTTLTMSDNDDDTITNINVAGQTGSRTYTVPDVYTAASFVMTAGAQDVGGAKNFTSTLGVGKDTSAGTLELFPSTGDKGTTTVTMSDNDGDTITNIDVAGQSGARTYTVPDVDAGTASFVMTAGAQEIAGAKNLTSTVGIGKDGSAGTLELFPSSSNQGTTTITMADNATDSITNINVAEQAGARTYTVPDAGASADFLLTDSYKTWWSIALGVVGEDTDGAGTNGGGLAGGEPDLTTHDFNSGATGAGDVLCKVFDLSMNGTTGTWDDLTTASNLDGWANNYQLIPNDEAIGDAVAIGFDTQFCEVVLNDLDTNNGQLATYGATGGKWQYSDGAASWADLTVFDNTDANNQVGGQPFSQKGALTFAPPSGWVERTIDGEEAYWIQWVVTAAQITQSAIIDDTNKDEPIVAIPNSDTFDAPFKATIGRVRVTDMGTTLHNTTIKFIVGNFTDGVFTEEFTWAASQRNDAFNPSSPLAVDANDLVGICITDDGGATNNPAFMIELEATYLN